MARRRSRKRPIRKRRASLGRAHRLGPRPGPQLAAHRLRQSDPRRRRGCRARLAICARHGRALGRAGRYSSARRRRWRPPSRTIRRPIRKSPGISPGSSKRSAASPPIRSSSGRTGCGPMTSSPTRARSPSMIMPAPTIPSPRSDRLQVAVDVSSVIRASQRVFPRRLDRAPLRERRPRRDRTLDRHSDHRGRDPRAMPSACAKIRSASSSMPSTGRRSSANASQGSVCAFLSPPASLAACATFKPPAIDYDRDHRARRA